MALLGTRVVSNLYDTKKYLKGERNNHIQHKTIKLNLESAISWTWIVMGNIHKQIIVALFLEKAESSFYVWSINIDGWQLFSEEAKNIFESKDYCVCLYCLIRISDPQKCKDQGPGL